MGKKCHLLPLDRGGARTEGRRQFWSVGKERERRPEREGETERRSRGFHSASLLEQWWSVEAPPRAAIGGGRRAHGELCSGNDRDGRGLGEVEVVQRLVGPRPG